MVQDVSQFTSQHLKMVESSPTMTIIKITMTITVALLAGLDALESALAIGTTMGPSMEWQ